MITPSLLCETVTGGTMSEMVAARDAASAADIVELRLDGVSDIDVGKALHGRRAPVIVTCRPVWEGGRFSGSEEARRRFLADALQLGAEYVDIEWAAGFDDLIRAHGGRVVVSLHDFGGIPGDLDGRVRVMRGTGAAVIKVAVTPARLADMLPLMSIARDGDAVVIGMGEIGLASRLLAARFGSRWTYAGRGVAPGQIPAARMLAEFRFRAVGARTAIYGVVGNNVMHSLSPVMHNAAFAAAGLDCVYVPLQAADFADFLEFADALGMTGASITIPFKCDALQAAATADDVTSLVGAANTIRRRGGGWDATNTDVEGFLEPLQALPIPGLDGLRVSVLGAGGAARAVTVALLSRGARVIVHARRPREAEHVAALLGVAAGPWPPAPGSWDILVNCTPLGSAAAPDESPLPQGPFGGQVVYDLTYAATESRLVRDARRAGCLALDGVSMLVAQAERQFEWWIGCRPAPGVMRAAARREIVARSEVVGAGRTVTTGGDRDGRAVRSLRKGGA